MKGLSELKKRAELQRRLGYVDKATVLKVDTFPDKVQAYGDLSIVSALLVGIALEILSQSRTAEDEEPGLKFAPKVAKVAATLVLMGNIFGTTIVVMQKHMTDKLFSQDFFR